MKLEQRQENEKQLESEPSPQENLQPVIHNEAKNRFEIQLSDEMGVLLYDIRDDTMDTLSVQAPPAFRNRGIASRVTQTALDYARGNGMKIIPTCPFVQAFVRRYAEYGALVKHRSTE